MKKITLLPFILLFIITSTMAQNNKPKFDITPTPLNIVSLDGAFTLSPKTCMFSNDKEVQKVINYFGTKIKRSTGYDIVMAPKTNQDIITLKIVPNLTVNNEGYKLKVTNKHVQIEAKTTQGLFYGMQTLMQLLPPEIESPTIIKNKEWTIPAVEITDEPRFKYRGQHLDVCRHFADIDFIKKQLDVLAMFKINRFHWHLTEDQGWRIEIKKYPKLTEIASKRTEGEGNTYGPFFYTQEQVKEVVAYAKERFIEVIPEIELPGHAVAALTAYPEYSCTGGPFEVRNVWGISHDILCAGNDATFSFLEDIINEVAPLFESEYFHIGGDEAPKTEWKKCPKCQARIKELGLTGNDEHTAEEQLQSYFIKRIEKTVLENGKKMIGWDEILEGGLAPSATVMSWRGEKGGIAAANMGHDVIMTPGQWLYLDHYQGDPKISPTSIGGYLPLSKTYSYDPVPESLSADKQKHIIGVQANVWTEYMYTTEIMEWRAYPRVIALSEVAWSAKKNKSYKDFERRIDNQRIRLDMHDINYYIPQPENKNMPSCNFIAFTDQATLEFKSTEPVKMVYTTDGSEPNLLSTVYNEPLIFSQSATLKIRSVLPSGKMGNIRTITIDKQSYSPSIPKVANTPSGLKAEYFKGFARKITDIASTPTETEYIEEPQKAKHQVSTATGTKPEDMYNTILTGYFTVPEDGVYYFSTVAEEMWLDGELFISNAGQIKRYPRTDRSIALAKGTHSIKLIRLSDTIGGWPAQWYEFGVNIRKDGDQQFKVMDANYFK